MDVVKFLLLLGLDVLVLLHPAGIFHVGPVGRQNHKVVHLIKDKHNLYWTPVQCIHYILISGKKYSKHIVIWEIYKYKPKAKNSMVIGTM